MLLWPAVLAALTPLAGAAPTVDDLLAPAGAPPAVIVGRCSRLADAQRASGALALLPERPAGLLPDPSQREAVLAQLDPDAPLTLRATREAAVLEVGLRAGAAPRVMGLLALAPEGPGLWRHPASGTLVADAGTRLRVTSPAAGLPARLPDVAFPPALAAGLPAGDGCTLGISTPAGAVLAALPTSGDAQPALLRMSIDALDAAALARPVRPPVPVRTPAAPLAVLTLGIAPGELVRAMGALNRAPIPPELEQDLAALGEVVQAQGGSVAAVFPDRSFAVVVPATTPSGGPLPVRRLSRAIGRALAREAGLPATRIGPSRFRIETPKAVAYLDITPAGLLIAANEPLLDAIQRGEGRPWLSPTHAEAAGDHLVTLRMDGGALPGPLAGLRLGAGLRATPAYLELSVFDRPAPEVLQALLPAIRAGIEAGKARAGAAGEGG